MSRHPLRSPLRSTTLALGLLVGGLALAGAPADAGPGPRATPAAPTSPRLFVSVRAPSDNLLVADRAVTGALTPAAGSPHTTSDDDAGGIAVSPRGFAYVVSPSNDVVRAFRLGADGSLSELAGSPYAVAGAAPNPRGVAISPDGSRLFVTHDGDSTVSAYAVAADGTLTEVAGSPYAYASSGSVGLALAPDGRHLYVGGYLGDLETYAVAPSGALTSEGTIALADTLGDLAITPDGRRLYVADTTSSQTLGYAIAADGSLAPLPGSPYPAPSAPIGLAVSPDGKDVYVASAGSATIIEGYAIAADGSLNGVTTASTNGNVVTPAVAPGGAFVYATSKDRVFGYARSASGVLTDLPGSPFDLGQTGWSSYRGLTIGPDLSPVASLVTSPSSQAAIPPGTSVGFDATGSTDPDGTIARYDWDFGDGTRLADGGPTPNHTYAQPGRYQATVTLTDDLGCSSALVYTGQNASCASTAGAALTRTLRIGTGPTITAQTRSRTDINARGWSRSRVVVRFTCAASPGTTLATACPARLVYRHQLHGRTVTRSVTDSVGITASVSVLVMIDGYQPFVTMHGVRNGATYAHRRQVSCTGLDHFTGRVPCHVTTHTHRHPDGSLTITYAATASDAAGNTTVRHGRYTVEG